MPVHRDPRRGTLTYDESPQLDEKTWLGHVATQMQLYWHLESEWTKQVHEKSGPPPHF